MPATIIQANQTPFETVSIDPVTLDIIENALRNARIEMDATLVRTAMSPGIREQGDAFPLIADHKGRMIVGQFGSYIGPFLDNFDGTVEEGDMIFLSDPYSVGGAISHLNDWLVLLPVYKDGGSSPIPRCSGISRTSAARSPDRCRSTRPASSRRGCASRRSRSGSRGSITRT